MHRRKEFIVYPPDYVPLVDKYKMAKSKRQAWKLANRKGCEVHENIYVHPAKHKNWISFGGEGRVWYIE